MNIGISSRDYSEDFDNGGVAAYTHHFTCGLKQLGHQVTIFSEHVFRARYKQMSIFKRSLLSILSYRGFLALEVRQFSGELDIIEVPDWGAEGGVLSLLKPVPLVLRLHSSDFIGKYEQTPFNLYQVVKRRIMTWFEKVTISRADLIICPSFSLAEIVAAKYHMPIDRIKIVRNPVNTLLFIPPVNGPSSEIQTVLYAGKLNKRKGVFTLVEAIPEILAQFPSTQFILVGADSDLPDQQSTVKTELLLRLETSGSIANVRFLDPQLRDSMVRLYQTSDICVVPSLYDNYPYTCTEAMACGKPVVVSDVGGLSEIVQANVTGLKCSANDPQALASAIMRLLNDEALRKTLGRNARTFVEYELSSVKIAQENLNYYQGIRRD